jgi:hypothetical protein
VGQGFRRVHTLAQLGCAAGELPALDASGAWTCQTASSIVTSAVSSTVMCEPVISYSGSSWSSWSSDQNLYTVEGARKVKATSISDFSNISIYQYWHEDLVNCNSNLLLSSSGAAYLAGFTTPLTGTYSSLGGNGTYLLDATGSVYKPTSASAVTPSAIFTGPGWSDAFIAAGADSTGGTWAACGIRSGAINCYDTIPTTGVSLPAPPTSTDPFVRAYAATGCATHQPAGASSAVSPPPGRSPAQTCLQ